MAPAPGRIPPARGRGAPAARRPAGPRPAVTATGFLPTPIGLLRVEATDTAIVGVDFVDDGPVERGGAAVGRPGPGLDACLAELEAYFEGRLGGGFTVPVDPPGTPFQRTVWRAMRSIPYGGTATYGDVAAAVGRPGAARAVGAACGANPVSVIVPCHRVVGRDGRLVGYGGGLRRKAWLLAHERSRTA